jgi:hypothetical protein
MKWLAQELKAILQKLKRRNNYIDVSAKQCISGNILIPFWNMMTLIVCYGKQYATSSSVLETAAPLVGTGEDKAAVDSGQVAVARAAGE